MQHNCLCRRLWISVNTAGLLIKVGEEDKQRGKLLPGSKQVSVPAHGFAIPVKQTNLVGMLMVCYKAACIVPYVLDVVMVVVCIAKVEVWVVGVEGCIEVEVGASSGLRMAVRVSATIYTCNGTMISISINARVLNGPFFS